MKIIKVSDTQIRCTIESSDLVSRNLQLSDLAYGSEKAKSLFQEIMKQADSQVGFVAEDAPLMIEAVPNGNASITLIITKVDSPESLDKHFPAHSSAAAKDARVAAYEKLEGAENYKERLKDLEELSIKKQTSKKKSAKIPGHFGVKLFSFPTLNDVMKASKLINPFYSSMNTLYKDEPNELYVLALTKGKHTEIEYSRICNMLTEFATLEVSNGISLAYLEEHCKVITSGDAIKKLAGI